MTRLYRFAATDHDVFYNGQGPTREYLMNLPGGTGYITDAGMTGAVDSVLGMKAETSMTRLVSKMSARYEPANGPAVINGIVFNTDASGRCLDIRRFCEYE